MVTIVSSIVQFYLLLRIIILRIIIIIIIIITAIEAIIVVVSIGSSSTTDIAKDSNKHTPCTRQLSSDFDHSSYNYYILSEKKTQTFLLWKKDFCDEFM